MNCASGRCEKCSLEESPNFADGLKLKTWLKEILGGEFLINGMENIKNASENIISSIKEDIFWGDLPIATKQIKRKINESIRNSLIYLVETPGKNNALLGLASIGLAANLNDSFRYITELGVKFPNQLLKVRKLAESSMSLVAKAMNIIDPPKLVTLNKEYRKLENEYKSLKNGKHDLYYYSFLDEIIIMIKRSLRMNRITKSILTQAIIGDR